MSIFLKTCFIYFVHFVVVLDGKAVGTRTAACVRWPVPGDRGWERLPREERRRPVAQVHVLRGRRPRPGLPEAVLRGWARESPVREWPRTDCSLSEVLAGSQGPPQRAGLGQRKSRSVPAPLGARTRRSGLAASRISAAGSVFSLETQV